MGTCIRCKNSSPLISNNLGACLDCIRNNFSEVWPHLEKVHTASRRAFGLPEKPPRDPHGILCKLCINMCVIGEGKYGYCGVRKNEGGRLTGVSAKEGNVTWYYDYLPTNCVADWVCAGCTGAGYPRFAHCPSYEVGYKNLAVFYQSCSFNCLFCQNWHYREQAKSGRRRTAQELAQAVDHETSCICYFGGDPATQLPHALLASRLARKRREGQILRICFETNGSMSERLLKPMANLALDSGGCIKFDLKAWDEQLNLALCGVSNKQTLKNFERLAAYIDRRPEPPFLIASTLLVPGYVDEEEVGKLAKFMAKLDPNIPYALLAFYPHFIMNDLPTTSRLQAQTCLQAAKDEGLRRVKIGNVGLLS